MPARLKLVGATSRNSIFLYDEDATLIKRVYADLGVSGFTRELVHRHCESIRQRENKARGATHADSKSNTAQDFATTKAAVKFTGKAIGEAIGD